MECEELLGWPEAFAVASGLWAGAFVLVGWIWCMVR